MRPISSGVVVLIVVGNERNSSPSYEYIDFLPLYKYIDSVLTNPSVTYKSEMRLSGCKNVINNSLYYVINFSSMLYYLHEAIAQGRLVCA